MKVDLSATDAGFEAIPAGRYLARITDGEIRTSQSEGAKHPGSEYISWEFTISEGEYAGRKQWLNTPLSHGTCDCDKWTPNALIGLKGLLTASGKFKDAQLAKSLNFEIEDLLGSEVILIVRVRQYQGEDRNEVKRVRTATPEAKEALEGASASNSLLA